MKIHTAACPYRDFDAEAHCRRCPDCDPRELAERCGCLVIRLADLPRAKPRFGPEHWPEGIG